jgi:hypothetical protein
VATLQTTKALAGRQSTIERCVGIGTNDISLDRVRDHLSESDLLCVTQYSTRAVDSGGAHKYFSELNTELEATIEVLDWIHRLDGIVRLVD